MEFFILMGKIAVILAVILLFVYVIDFCVKTTPVKAVFDFARTAATSLKDQVLVPAWVRILKKWRNRK